MFLFICQQLSSQKDIVHIESDSSVEFGVRKAEATTAHDQVTETSHAATQCPCEAVGEVGSVSMDNGQRRRRATVSGVEKMSMSNSRKSSVSSSAADLLAKLMCVRRKMRLTDNSTTTV